MDTFFTPAQNITEAIGWMLLHSLWTGLVLALLTAFLLKSLSPHKAVLRYRLAWSSLIFFILANSCLLYLYWPEASPAQTSESGMSLMVFAERPVQTNLLMQYFHTLKNALPRLVQFWGIGLIFFLLRFAWGFRQMQQYRHKGLLAIPEKWLERFDSYAAEMGVKNKKVRVFESLLIQAPMLIGHFKPLILLPAGIMAQAPPEYIEAVLRHELAHIRRNDFLISILQNLVEVVFYFNPFVWWISGQIRKEREHCCDDLVVCHSGKPRTYARALLYFRESMDTHRPLQAVALLPKRSPLFVRIQRLLLQETTLHQSKKFVMEKTIVTMLLIFSILFFAFQPAQTKQYVPAKTPSAETMPASTFSAIADTLPEPSAPKPPQKEEVKEIQIEVNTSDDGDRAIIVVRKDNKDEPVIIIDTVITFDSETFDEDTSYLIFWKDKKDLDQFQLEIANEQMASALATQLNMDSLSKVLSQMTIELRKVSDSLHLVSDSLRLQVSMELDDLISKSGMPDIAQPELMDLNIQIDTIITFDPETFEETREIVVHINDAAPSAPPAFGAPPAANQQDIIITTDEALIVPFANTGPINSLIEEAQQDGLLPDKDHYSFMLSPKKLLINGKKQPRAVFEKYKQLYEQKSGRPLTGKIKIQVNR